MATPSTDWKSNSRRCGEGTGSRCMRRSNGCAKLQRTAFACLLLALQSAKGSVTTTPSASLSPHVLWSFVVLRCVLCVVCCVCVLVWLKYGCKHHVHYGAPARPPRFACHVPVLFSPLLSSAFVRWLLPAGAAVSRRRSPSCAERKVCLTDSILAGDVPQLKQEEILSIMLRLLWPCGASPRERGSNLGLYLCLCVWTRT